MLYQVTEDYQNSSECGEFISEANGKNDKDKHDIIYTIFSETSENLYSNY